MGKLRFPQIRLPGSLIIGVAAIVFGRVITGSVESLVTSLLELLSMALVAMLVIVPPALGVALERVASGYQTWDEKWIQGTIQKIPYVGFILRGVHWIVIVALIAWGVFELVWWLMVQMGQIEFFHVGLWQVWQGTSIMNVSVIAAGAFSFAFLYRGVVSSLRQDYEVARQHDWRQHNPMPTMRKLGGAVQTGAGWTWAKTPVVLAFFGKVFGKLKGSPEPTSFAPEYPE